MKWSRRLCHGPQNARYTSPEIQNLLLAIMGGIVQEKICDSVRAAGPFSIMADECKDASKTEQLSIAIRYVEAMTGTMHEHFLTLVKVSSLTAESNNISH